MLNNLSNFWNIITGRMIKKIAEPSDLIPLGTRDSRYGGNYKPTAISIADFIAQLNIQPDVTVVGLSIWANGFRVIGCIDEDILLPDNATLEYTSPLTMCAGRTLTIPAGTTLTIVP